MQVYSYLEELARYAGELMSKVIRDKTQISLNSMIAFQTTLLSKLQN